MDTQNNKPAAPRKKRPAPAGRRPAGVHRPVKKGAPVRKGARRPAQKKLSPWLYAGAAGAALLLCLSLTAVIWALARPRLQSGAEVLVNGVSLGIVSEQSAAENALQQLLDRRSGEYGLTAVCADEVTYRGVKAQKEYFVSPEALTQHLQEKLDVRVLAQVIMVDGRQAVALRTAEEAQQALDTVLERFASPSQGREDLHFVEQVSVEEHTVPYAAVTDAATAAQKLIMGGNLGKENWHTVEKGETVQSIAEIYNLSAADIYQANPGLAGLEGLDDVEKVNAVQPKSWLNVVYTVTASKEETTKYNTIEEKSDSLYTGSTKVKQQGQDGIALNTVKNTYRNGELCASEVLASTVVQEKIDKIMLVGTKKVASGSWALPLDAGTYRVSSQFGMRTLNGTTRQHKGVDLAAAKGTKIHASRDGTVAFAGTATGYGLVVYVNHSGNAQTRYAHCSKLLVKAGEKVKKGQVIALVGNTGVSTGPHCHFEVRINGTPVNPLTYNK